MAAPHSLVPFMSVCFEQAKLQLARAERLGWVIGGVGLIVAILPVTWEQLAWWLGLGSLAALLIQRVLLYWFRERHCEGERIKRRLILADGLGDEIGEEELADLKAEFGDLPGDGSPYTATTLEPGAKRLAAVVRECAWWTSKLQRLVACRFWWRAACTTGLFVLVILALLFVVADQGLGGTGVAKGAAAILALLVAVDYWGRWWECREVSVHCERYVERCTGLLKNGEADLKQVVPVALDYCAATVVSYPIPTSVYEGKQEHLNRLWSQVDCPPTST